MSNITFAVNQVGITPDLFKITVTVPDQAQIEVFLDLEEITNFLHDLGQQCLHLAAQCQQIATDNAFDEIFSDSEPISPTLH